MCLTDRKLERTDIPATTLSYNVDGQLLSTTTPLGTTTYGYAADGKRVWSQKPGEAKRFYIYSGDVLIGEIYNDTTQPSISSYTYGPDGLLAIQQDTTTYWPVYGPQGETRALTDVNGAVVQTYAYDGYGIQIPTTLPATVRNPFQYGGKYGYYTDHESGFILATYRWYSPQLRRWVSRDPIGYEGGVNLYEYVRSNPIGFVDPLGQEAFLEAHQVVGPFYHLKIKLVPDNASRFKRSRYGKAFRILSDGSRGAFIGAGPGWVSGLLPNLVAKLNRTSDVQNQSHLSVALSSSTGTCDTAAIFNLLRKFGQYRNSSVPYDPLPRFGDPRNSNSFITGLIPAAGFLMPDLTALRSSLPGYNLPVSSDEF
jgi:RHS repeat-associated protein